MSKETLNLRDYTLFTELAIREFIEECEISEEEKLRLTEKLDRVLNGAYYVPDYIHTVADMLCKVLGKEEYNSVLSDAAKKVLLKGETVRYYEGCLESVNKEQIIRGLLDFLEQEGCLLEFITIWKENYIDRIV